MYLYRYTHNIIKSMARNKTHFQFIHNAKMNAGPEFNLRQNISLCTRISIFVIFTKIVYMLYIFILENCKFYKNIWECTRTCRYIHIYWISHWRHICDRTHKIQKKIKLFLDYRSLQITTDKSFERFLIFNVTHLLNLINSYQSFPTIRLVDYSKNKTLISSLTEIFVF